MTSLEVYQEEMARYPLLTPEQMKTATPDELVQGNLRFAYQTACQYLGKGAPVEELICAANKGLVQAAQRFDASRGFQFTTYAVWWIKQAIREMLPGYAWQVRLPANVILDYNRVHRAETELAHLHGRFPTRLEMIDEVGDRYDHLVKSIWREEISLDAPVGPDLDDKRQRDLIADEGDILEDVEEKEIVDRVKEAMGKLKPRTAQILERYYLEDLTLEEIGNELGLTRERIRQIKDDGLKEMQTLTKRAGLYV